MHMYGYFHLFNRSDNPNPHFLFTCLKIYFPLVRRFTLQDDLALKAA